MTRTTDTTETIWCRRIVIRVAAAVIAAAALGTGAAQATPASAFDGVTLAPVTHSSAAAAPVVLKIVWQQQTRSYNCGPAASRIVLSALVQPGKLASQEQLAEDEGTNPNSGTYRTGVAAGLNKYTPSLRWEPSTGNIWTGVTGAINKKRPLPIAIEIGSPSELPPGWSRDKVGVQHWFVAYGYNALTKQVLISDPASTGPGFNPSDHYWISLQALRSIHVAHVRPTAP